MARLHSAQIHKKNGVQYVRMTNYDPVESRAAGWRGDVECGCVSFIPAAGRKKKDSVDSGTD